MKKTSEIVSYNLESFEMPALIELSEMDLAEVSGGASENPECGSYTVICGVHSCVRDGGPPPV
jgi:hypothetical protein